MKQVTTLLGFLTLFLGIIACSIDTSSLPSREQVEGGLATAQALGEQASALATNVAPTLQAAAQNASELATRTAPTIVALQTQASTFATEAAPTLEAGLEQLATAAVEAQENSAAARATLQAAGIDANYLRQKVASLRPDENGNINATFTETEVNLVLQMRSSGTETLENGQTVTMQNTQVRFTEGVIIYTSRVTSPIEGDLRLVMQPYVVDGVMQLSLVSADLGGQTIPQFMVGMVETTLNATLNGAFSQLPGSVTLTALYVNEGSLTFVANRNG